MKLLRVIEALGLSGLLVCVGRSQTIGPAGSPPPAPAGYRWEPVPELSDEFEGAGLDASKWLPYQPYWEGRPPSRFATNNVMERDGRLELRSTALVTNLAQVRDPEKDIWVQSACVTSAKPIAGYGYYAARLKASRLPMTSAFWFQGKYSEIDVVEQVGASRKNPGQSKQMLMDTHFFQGGWGADKATPKKWTMPTAAADQFHVYGVWWKDKDSVWFYHDGKKVAEVKTAGEFLEPMYLFFDTEVFTWEGLPTVESLNNPKQNTMQVDWVRGWRLARASE
jgi:beta-glucanase (GH16 family)